MKKLLLLIMLPVSNLLFSQLVIGNETGTAADKTSVLLDFAQGQNKGIILPYTRTVPSGQRLAEGTLILDASNPLKAKVKLYNGIVTPESPDGWLDLSSGNEADVSSAMTGQPDADAVTESPVAQVIIGADNSEADGVLVLESEDHAMILPMVDSTDDIVNPAPGMIVYINREGAKRLAVFNGAVWTYWKP